ncbi:hypothetical protein ETD86_30085 [Nonomuraea turkmeniaca]|uniref:Uncharacterized protein n=1 Tax=Nonomuraea turkmeniaca TaxID=103838 RepID=A0A5S4F9T3_9ACTN|nr:hypothetical protein [Nonomuraea turkmeniaca]TMR13816.1 hypothetical protein ETD86_30085 [Nonomuraea turkmeniaca]
MSDGSNLAEQIAEVRRLLEVGFTETKGQLALLILRTETGEQRHAELADSVATQFREVRAELDKHAERIADGEKERAAAAALVEWSKRKAVWISIGISIALAVIGWGLQYLGRG